MTKYRDEDNPYPGKVSGSPHDIYKRGFLAAEKLYGWHRNCEETPVPNDCRVIIKGSDFMRIAHALTSDGNLFICGNVNVFRSEITHWREIPEIEG